VGLDYSQDITSFPSALKGASFLGALDYSNLAASNTEDLSLTWSDGISLDGHRSKNSLLLT
jgi:hypothetical protein